MMYGYGYGKPSQEYLDFLRSLVEKKSSIEKVFSAFGFLKFCPKSLKEKYQEAIEFAHIKNTPEEIFSSSLVIPTLIFIMSFTIAAFVNSFFILFLGIVFSGMTFFHIYQYPFIKAKTFKMEASSEMMLAVIYIGVSMKLTPNLERAIYFAAKSLKGPLAKDLAKVLWDVYTQRYTSLSQSLNAFIEKWKHENEEFTEAMTIIKNAFSERMESVSAAVDEAVNLMLEESKAKMEKNVREMKSPLVVLNALGILLPILGMMFLPVISIFVPEIFDFPMTVTLYDIVLPWFIFWFISTYLSKRPYTFHQPEIPKERFWKQELIGKAVGIAIIILTLAFTISPITHSETKFLPSVFLILGLGVGIAVYFLLPSFLKMKFRNKIVKIENEIGEFVFILAMSLRRGKPVEETVEELKEKVKTLTSKELVEQLSYNIKVLGMPLSRALLDVNSGIVAKFPSRIINAIMTAIAEIAGKGMFYLSQALMGISTYLKNMRKVEETISDELSEVTMNMKLQAWLLAPVTAGIVVALMAVTIQILSGMQGLYEKLQGSTGEMKGLGMQIMTQFIDFQKLVGPWAFQLTLGIYLIETVVLLSYFTSLIEHGGESVIRDFEIGKTLLIATSIYVVLVLVVYFTLSSIARFVL
ncbi:MAG: hypothetical protein J7K98_00820 [Candidatus Aenigmarchaeota archaeon]|nr:hypothetical protein [Candidatus Aenigmarchaeota archaeon]